VAPMSDSYSLSPDGSKLAVVAVPLAQSVEGAAQSGQIAVIDVGTQAVLSVGADAVGYPVSWSPDSSWFAYTAQAGEKFAVKRVQSDGTGDEVLTIPGASPRVSRDGNYIAYMKSNQPGLGDPLTVLTLSTGKKRAVPQGKGALAWGWGTGKKLFFTRGTTASPQEWDLWRYTVGADSSRTMGSVSVESPGYSLVDVRVSPDGKRVLMAAAGDDNYSRLWVFDTSAERFSAIQTRRDAYPCCWGDDDQILYFEGNTYQGEPSALVSILADGTSRRMIITGAHR
jgi:Tol biopolymer transport system component